MRTHSCNQNGCIVPHAATVCNRLRSNCKFNVDANMGHRFAILMAHVGALRPYGLRRR